MTAVASPPSVQPLSRWSSANNGGEGLESMSAEEVSRMFMPRKSIQRQNFSGSASSSSTLSTTSSGSAQTPQTNGDSSIPATNSDQGGWGPRKKAPRGLWPSSKADPVSSVSTARPEPLPTPSSGQSAASTMNSTLQQPTSQQRVQQNGSVAPPSSNRGQSQPQHPASRSEQQTNQADSTAILALLPMTGTFERKQIIVPFFPDVQKIGRQTNAKTVPTATNGFFDSKVLSRQHAEIWADRNGKIWIRDVKSSNGTFVNGIRLSPENRDSEPHELREGDTLELGIDIVSEDQKSIVHHKVSAKVELAGLYSNAPTLLDMMHVDANTGQPLGDQMGQSLSQMRGRNGSQGTMGSNGRLLGPPSMSGAGVHMLGGQRQVNMWMGPITVEQVVKKLTGELKQAKQQSHDLHRTGDFFGALLTLEPGEEPPKSPPKFAPEEKQTNGVPPPSHIDSISPFSQPPAPPPSQPLPEKPDVARFGSADSLAQPPFKRMNTERPRSGQSSPTKEEPHNSQIISLLEALKHAKDQIDSQGDRVKHLELALQKERKARETAEMRAHALSGGRRSSENQQENGAVEEAFDPPLDSLELLDQDLRNGHIDGTSDRDSLLSSKGSMETLKDASGTSQNTEEVDASTSRLQARLDLMVLEMNEMKNTMESYKRRAEDAEDGRKSLAEMVERIRAGNSAAHISAPKSVHTSSTSFDSTSSAAPKDPSVNKNDDNHGLWTSPKPKQPNGTAGADNLQQELERTLSSVLQQQRAAPAGGGRMVQSAPYVSMVGVVLIGVGLMTWLNGWQPGGGER